MMIRRSLRRVSMPRHTSVPTLTSIHTHPLTQTQISEPLTLVSPLNFHNFSYRSFSNERKGGIFSDINKQMSDEKKQQDEENAASMEEEEDSTQNQETDEHKGEKGRESEQKKEEEPLLDRDTEETVKKVSTYAGNFWSELKTAASDLFTIDREETVLTRKLKRHEQPMPPPSADSVDDEEIDYSGPAELLVVDQDKSTWDRLADRLREAPLYQELLRRAKEAGQTEFGQKASEGVDGIRDRIENAQNAWETSQNPWVYRVSEVWDALTHETDTAIILKELRRMDPNFSLEVWKEDVSQKFVPKLLEAWLRGDKNFLRAWCTEDTYKRLFNDIVQREKEKVLVDPNVLSVDFAEVIVDPKLTEQNALLGLFVACQQISCVRDRTGEIVEGAEDNIKLMKYFLVFQREYIAEEGELRWKVADFGLQGEEYIAV